jgi:hypothetical protein
LELDAIADATSSTVDSVGVVVTWCALGRAGRTSTLVRFAREMRRAACVTLQPDEGVEPSTHALRVVGQLPCALHQHSPHLSQLLQHSANRGNAGDSTRDSTTAPGSGCVSAHRPADVAHAVGEHVREGARLWVGCRGPEAASLSIGGRGIEPSSAELTPR